MQKNDDVCSKYTYRVTWSEEDQEFIGLCTEFPSLSWLSATQEGALAGIKKVVCEVVSEMTANGEAVPEPISVRQYSGKLMVRIPPGLHRQLALEAAEANVSLNRLISAKLSQ
ncbi:MAG TPA: toxin-antitoxin system HicB family antitoxin [Geomonas sp.]|nr:toxin-antitoxin system HicB family antitoxin [Geomonas sp.]